MQSKKKLTLFQQLRVRLQYILITLSPNGKSKPFCNLLPNLQTLDLLRIVRNLFNYMYDFWLYYVCKHIHNETKRELRRPVLSI